jgi:uncharacterized protein
MPQARYANTFIWLDLHTSDREAAKKFYGTLFDWSYDEVPIKGGPDYSIALVRGSRVAGISPTRDANPPMPSQWISYVSVENVDEVAKTAESMGARLLQQPLDVTQLGRVAVVEDLSGGVVGVWQTTTSQEPALFNQHGTLNWNELATNDPAGARDFYTSLFGWSVEEQLLESGAPYVLFNNGDQSACGMRQSTRDAQTNWRAYFDVDDTDARIQKARAAGGEVIKGPIDTMFGRLAMLRDPHGAPFSVISASETVQHFPF